MDDTDKEWYLCKQLRTNKQGFVPASFIQRTANDREAYQQQVLVAPLTLPARPCSYAACKMYSR